MIKITNGANVLLVTNGSYKEQYKPLGWVPVDEKAKVVELPNAAEKRAERKEAEVKKETANSVPVVLEEKKALYVPEKPLSEMSNAELKAKAKQLGVNISGLETRKQVRAAISNAMRE